MKQFFLTMTLAALVGSAAIGILVAWTGEFEGLQQKLLLTLLVVGAFSLTGMASASRSRSWWLSPLGFVGMIASLAALMVVVLLIWDLLVKDQRSLRVVTILVVSALSLGHLALLLGLRPGGEYLRMWWSGAILMALLLAGLLVAGILEYVDPAKRGLYIRVVSVVAILDALGTLGLGLLHHMGDSPDARPARRRRA
ncbi:MAG: hypothetical protein EXR46_02240 [Dehalococcoidia bacterium]|nr:hypothetical protein [Dehalococcoidia bacterium]